MKFHRLYTVLAICAILFSAAVPIGLVAAQDSTAVLRVTVTPDAGLAATVDTVGYTVVVTNTSNNPAHNVVVEEALNPKAAWTVDNAGCSIGADGLLQCKLGDLPGGESVEIHVSGDAQKMGCGSFSEAVKASATNALTVQDDAKALTHQCYAAVSIVKTAAVSEVEPGEPISFRMAVKSSGTVTALNVVVRDELPVRAGLSWSITEQTPTAACEIAAGELICNYPYIWVGASEWVTITATTTEDSCGLVRNTASVEASNEPESEWGNNESTAEVNVNCPVGPQLSITKTVDDGEVMVGSTVGFTITVTNTGSALANDIVIKDQLDSYLVWELEPGEGTTGPDCTIESATDADQVLTCTIASLDVNESASVHVTATSSTAVCGLLTNTASVEADNISQVTAEAEVTILCPEGVNVNITKVAEAETIKLGELAQFTMTVSNTSTVAAENVILTDVLPVVSGLSWTITPAVVGCGISGGTLTCDFGAMAVGASQRVTISAEAGEGSCGTIPNSASITAKDEPAENLSDNSDDASILVDCTGEGPKLEVTKQADSLSVQNGAAIGFTVTINNTGDQPATGIVLEDQLFEDLAWSETTGADCSFNETQLMTCNFPSLAAGASISVHVTAMTNSEACGQIANTASVEAADLASVSSNQVIVTVVCVQGVNVKITKTTPRASVNQGEAIVFTMVVNNDSLETATDVVLKDTLPTVSGLSWSIVAPIPSGCSIAAGVLTCNFGTLGAGQSGTVQITSPSDNSAGVISNTGTVTASNETAGYQADNTSTAQLEIPVAACLNLNIFNGMYLNNFEGARPGTIGIKNYIESVAPKGQRFMGDYDNQTVSLTVGCLPPHNALMISFDLYIIRSWDGNTVGAGPDRWKMELEGRNTPLVDTTFSNWSWSPQAYPGNYPNGNYGYQTGAAELRALGYVYDRVYKEDAIYHISMAVPHTGTLATFNFTGMGLQPKEDESWGIDSMVVVPIGLNQLYVPMLIDDGMPYDGS